MDEKEKSKFSELEKECLEFIEKYGGPGKRNGRGCCSICFEYDVDKANEIRRNSACPCAGFMRVFLPNDTELEYPIHTYECDFGKNEKKEF